MGLPLKEPRVKTVPTPPASGRGALSAEPDVGEQNWRRIKATVRPLKANSSSTVVTPGLTRGRSQQSAQPPATQGQARGDVNGKGQTSARAVSASPLTVAPDLIRGRSRPDTLPPAPAQGRGDDAVGASPLAKDWERTLRTGRATPDMVIDLHGHNLSGAHSQLARALDSAAASRARIILVIAGKSRGPDEAPRGAIRRELATWLAHSHHAGRILAVRNAHPRHGGAGAVYVVLRKG